MGLLGTLFGAITGGSKTQGGTNPLLAALGGLFTQNGGMQGLMSKFSQGGLGSAFASWTGMGENQPVTPQEIHNVLGPEQLQQFASKLGMDPSQASVFLAEHLPKVVDKLTPTGEVDPNADHHQGLAAMLPSLLESIGAGAA